MSAERRAQILDAAGSVIAERGICDTRVADIAEQVGISPALILYYFPSKERLLAEALAFRDEQFFAEMTSRLAGVERAADRLAELITASCPPSPVDAGEEWLLWLELWARARHDPALAAARARMDREFRDLIARIVRLGVDAGEFAPVDAEEVALHLSALIDGLAIQVMLDPAEVPPAAMRDLCCSVASRILECPIGRSSPSRRRPRRGD